MKTHSTAVGALADATGIGSTAIGWEADATANNTTSLGNSAKASGVNSTALGRLSNTAGFANSVAIGHSAINTAANQVQMASTVAGVTTTRTVTGVSAGALLATSTDAVNGSQLFATNMTVASQATQITALPAADAGLASRVGSLESLAIDFEDRLDDVDDRGPAGTAVAIALGANSFIPGKQFNLTGNSAPIAVRSRRRSRSERRSARARRSTPAWRRASTRMASSARASASPSASDRSA